MENYQGDLADIVRASGGPISNNMGNISGEVPAINNWQFPSDPMNYPSGIDELSDDFGDPFTSLRDPLLHELDMQSPVFFNCSTNMMATKNSTTVVEDTRGFGHGLGCAGGGSVSGSCANIAQKNILNDEMKRPCNIFSRVLQISPNAKFPVSPCDSPVMVASPRGLTPPSSLVSNDHMISPSSSKGCLVENPGVQISVPRNTGIKRRKSQAKKVVCIPAPAPATSRPSSGEVVPSDLWAWRKYGQKPIKGSPYPRGYYRCSSSKGCSARKQVERSRTDPNMLVITYTSEHNHPWPTQRNALAGSTRSQPSKNNSTSKNSPGSEAPTNLKEEQKESNTDHNLSIVTGSSTISPSVKEEMEDFDKQIGMDDSEFSEDFPQSYRPALPDSNHAEDFFADLGEIEADPLNLLFSTHGFCGDDRENNKGLDPFSFCDWIENNNNSNNSSSFGEAKKGL